MRKAIEFLIEFAFGTAGVVIFYAGLSSGFWPLMVGGACLTGLVAWRMAEKP